jgi:hypothetical protein
VSTDIANGYIEFTPINQAAEAVILLATHATNKNRIFHVYNNKHIYITKFIETLKELYNKTIEVISNDEFYKKLDMLIKNPEGKKILQGIIYDLNENKKLVYESNIILNCDFTVEFLKKIGFEWINIDKGYLQKLLNYINSIGFIEL